jgi:Zn finger protein HypA/HybF involved in hydrogenase expression
MKVIALPTPLTCLRCGYIWTPRKTVVYICPRCKSAKWQVKKERV